MIAKSILPIVRSSLPIDKAVGFDVANASKPFYTRSRLRAKLGRHEFELPTAYCWNGADIPRFAWTIVGVAPTDPRAVIASGFHDDGCERADVPQVIADALFVSLLG